MWVICIVPVSTTRVQLHAVSNICFICAHSGCLFYHSPYPQVFVLHQKRIVFFQKQQISNNTHVFLLLNLHIIISHIFDFDHKLELFVSKDQPESHNKDEIQNKRLKFEHFILLLHVCYLRTPTASSIPDRHRSFPRSLFIPPTQDIQRSSQTQRNFPDTTQKRAVTTLYSCSPSSIFGIFEDYNDDEYV